MMMIWVDIDGKGWKRKDEWIIVWKSEAEWGTARNISQSIHFLWTIQQIWEAHLTRHTITLCHTDGTPFQSALSNSGPHIQTLSKDLFLKTKRKRFRTLKGIATYNMAKYRGSGNYVKLDLEKHAYHVCVIYFKYM